MCADNLDRIFQRDRMNRLFQVDFIEQNSGQRSGLAASRGTRNQDDPVLLLGHFIKHFGELQLIIVESGSCCFEFFLRTTENWPRRENTLTRKRALLGSS